MAERKRTDRLQEKLQEIMSDSKSTRQSIEDLFQPITFTERQKSGDSSSMSSLSPCSISRDNVLSQSSDEDCGSMSLQQENEELLKRLADIQQMKWILEEKVSHLEASNAAMAEDLIRKTAIIDHFSMDGRAGLPFPPSQEKMTLKRVMNFVMDKGDEGLKDANHRLQNVVEETLTKNMHLQQNLEMISQELDDLKKLHNLSSITPTVTSCD